ncbi:MAG: bifunctional YncE family protein/alkaline phosphatase family protein [Acidobacteria bacterium]|nr:bifunctional YncE family protein/alkaline phosphatase family protein [Acidobacteriota bacterium]
MQKAVLLVCVVFALLMFSGARENVVLPGKRDVGTLLPNQWRLTPAGRHVTVGDLPLKMVLAPDRKHVLVATNGYNDQGLTVIEVATGNVTAHAPLWQTYSGLDVMVTSPTAAAVFLSGARSGKVFVFRYALGKAALENSIAIPGFNAESSYLTGLALAPKRNLLLLLNSGDDALLYIDLKSQGVTRTVRTRYRPYAVVVDTAAEYAYISNWGGRSVSRLNIEKGELDATLSTGDHPTDMVFSADGRTLFVANSNSDTVSVLDLATQSARETISMSLTPRSPQGAVPMGLSLSPDGKRLAVANAGNNNIALVDISEAGESKVLGFIPTGWYPTSTLFDPSGRKLFIGSGKGLGSSPNPQGPVPTLPPGSGRDGSSSQWGSAYQYIRRLIPGSVSMVDLPDAATLRKYTGQVMANSPYRDELLEKAAGEGSADSIVPARVGDPSPIKHVLYIIKENRTYDQVFGDIKEGNGDPSLVLFGENVTPNHHKIAREFVLLDNFYCSGDVSVDGHAWSDAAFVTDFHEKQWPTQYAQRGRMIPDPEHRLARPRAGYIWERAEEKGLTIRSYGEMVTAPSLQGKFCPDYRQKDPDKPWRDSDRAEVFLREFEEFERNGNLPSLIVMSLPENHTAGTRPGAFTPIAMVANNDLAVGRIVERVTRSRYWKEMAILVLEDDAQNGPDHVDSHRSVALVISPYSRLRRVDSTFYTTCSVLRTMELLLGLRPLTQYDASSYAMFRSFGRKPDLAPYQSVTARVDLYTKNGPNAYGARASLAMNFDEVDEAPEQELNEILWKSIKGADSKMPPPVRRLLPPPLYATR